MMPPKKTRTTSSSAFSATRGVLLAFASGVIISVACFLVQHTPNIHPGQHGICRFWVVASLALPQLIFRRENIFGPASHRISIFFAALVNATTMALQFITLKYLPLGEAAVLFSSYPVFVTIAGRIFLKEKFGILQVIAVIMGVVGVTFTTGLHKTVADPSRVYSMENCYGLAFAMATTLSATAIIIILRKLRNIHFSVILFSTGIVGVLESVFLTELMGSFSLPVGDLQRVFIIIIGLMSALALICSVCSLKYAQAGPVSVVRASTEIFFSFLWQVFIFGNMPDGLTILGSVLVSLSVVLMGFNQSIRKFLAEKLIKVS